MKKLLLILLLAMGLGFLFIPLSNTHAQGLFTTACDSSDTYANANSAVCQNKDKPERPECNSFYGKCGILIKVAGLIALATGVVAVIFIIVAGFKLVTSSGDPNNIKSAKNTIIFAIVGLVVSALATVIIQFVLKQL